MDEHNSTHYGTRNYRAMLDEEALIEKLQYGSLHTTKEFHRKRIIKQTFYGKERRIYTRVNAQDAIKDILTRMKKIADEKGNEKLTFEISFKYGLPQQIIWLSEISVHYDIPEEDLTKSPQN